MTFLAPWALVIAGLAAAGVMVLHLVLRQRPATYLLPTARFIPDQRTLVNRVATRPRDLVLLALRVLLLLFAGAAFARPLLSPTRGTVGRIVLLDRSRSVASAPDAVGRARALSNGSASVTVIAFDTAATVLSRDAWDSVAAAPRSGSRGSLTTALVAARRMGAALAQHVDSLELHLVSPLAGAEFDVATDRARSAWPGFVRVDRVALRQDSSSGWRLDRALAASDQLGPAMASVRNAPRARVTRLVRGAPTGVDSAFARDGGTVVRWDTAAAPRLAAEGLAVGDDVIVAALGRIAVGQTGRVVARWADGTRAAEERVVGKGCMREVGIRLPAAGDIALHPPFQRIARALLAPCGVEATDVVADSGAMARLGGEGSNAAPASALRSGDDRPSPLARWLLAAALLCAIAELLVRSRRAPEPA
ncbi:hypothetical protein BH11GEM1_BH11GEM1_13170 [soil metagenome]